MSTQSDTPLLAVLIDADNTSPKYTKALFDEIASLGEASVRRCYGDFSSQQMAGWSKVQAEFGLVPHHQPANTVGKNASDIALVIDAMDLMHSGRFDGFVLVSSDSDFTRLASRIREQGLDVFGMGMRKTPSAFVKACKRFIYLENLESEPSQGTPDAKTKPAGKSLNDARDLILKAMDAIDQEDDWYMLGLIGQFITTANPDFDTRSFGYKKLSELVQAIPALSTKREGNHVLVQAKKKTGGKG
ncbi:NYN domain-containing protein [Arenibacterium sp. CAU 1754]